MPDPFVKYFGAGDYNAVGWGPTMVPLHGHVFDKLASDLFIPAKIASFIDGLKPDKAGAYIMLNALGASEAWGANRNNDAFQEYSIKGAKAPQYIYDLAKQAGLRIPPKWGIETFETHGGIYEHHKNHDPRKSYGKVCIGEWSGRMKRGELVVFVLREKAPHIVKAAEEGIILPWSMGARLSFDECVRCHHLARNRREYCKHAAHNMGEMSDDGTKNVVNNPFPVFFDISKVGRPADRSAWSLMAKVAEHATIFDIPRPVPPKIAEKKVGDLVKKVDPSGPGGLPKELWTRLQQMVRTEQKHAADLSDSTIAVLRGAELPNALRALTAVGIVLKPHELSKVAAGKSMPKKIDMSHTGGIGDLLNALSGDCPGRSLFGSHPVRRIRIVMIRKIPSETGKPEKKTASYRQYLDLISRTGVDELHRVRQDPRVVLASDADALGDLFFDRTSPDEHELLPFLAALT